MTHEWLDTSAYPFRFNYFNVNGCKLHYIDEGQGETILFVHGTPSWSFDFRNVIKGLSSHFRCLAIDHIGFGLSDKPEQYDYATQAHSKTLEKFALAKRLTNVTLVVHDFGGPIALNFAIQHPEKIKALVVLNSWMWSSEADAAFIKLKRVLKSPLLPFLYRYLNFSPRFILPKSFGEHKLSKHLQKQYTKPFANKTQREGTIAFAKSLLNDQDWFESLWDKRKTIADKPTLFIWGMRDSFVGRSYLHKFVSGFSNTTVVELPACGHFPQEEQPAAVANAIFCFLSAENKTATVSNSFGNQPQTTAAAIRV